MCDKRKNKESVKIFIVNHVSTSSFPSKFFWDKEGEIEEIEDFDKKCLDFDRHFAHV